MADSETGLSRNLGETLCDFCRPRLLDLSSLGWKIHHNGTREQPHLTWLEPEVQEESDGSLRLAHRSNPDAFLGLTRYPDDYCGHKGVEVNSEECCIKLEYYRQDTLPECPEITLSSCNGCYFCILLLKLIREDHTDLACSEGTRPVFASVEFYFISANAKDTNILSVSSCHRFILDSLVIRKASPPSTRDHFFLLIASRDDFVTSPLLNIPRRPKCEDVLDERNVALIKSWIDVCDNSEQHLPCRIGNPTSLPTRILDVSNLANTGDIRLVITDGQRANYVALSYCWISESALAESSLTTTSTNLSSMLRSIPVSLLNKSQITCLTLAQKLAVKYVWIDSLCIVQDDDSDWRTESANMDKVYENATLTIIPSASLPDPAKRKPGDFWHDLPWTFGHDAKLTGRYTVSAADGESDEIWWNGEYRSEPLPFVNFLPGSENFIWRSRGWTFQEEQFSRRKLYLGDTRMQFICTKSRGVEDTLWLRKKYPLKAFTDYSSLLLAESSRPDQGSSEDQYIGCLTARQAYDFWYRTVNAYGDRLLTYSTDTIVAIGGLAKRLAVILQRSQPSYNSEYVGGIWKADLIPGILWASSDIERSEPVPLPCWSQLPSRPVGASWLWSSFPLPNRRAQKHIPDKPYRYRFLLEGQNTPACNMVTSDCRIISWAMEPESAPVFTPTHVHGEIEITGKIIELDLVWEFRVSPFEDFQPLALPAPLKAFQGYDDSEIDTQQSAGISVRFNWPFSDHPSTRSWDDAVINIGIDRQWTQTLHDNVSRGEFRVFAVLMAYGVMKHPPAPGQKVIHRMSTIGLLLVPDDPKDPTPKCFQRFGLFLLPGRNVSVSESGGVLDAEKARPCMHKAFRLGRKSTIVVH